MLSSTILNLLITEIANEQYASQCYRVAENCLSNMKLQGFAAWCHKQAEDECEHAEKIMEYITDHLNFIDLMEIPPASYQGKSLLEIFTALQEAEQKTTLLINNLMKVAMAENDFATQNLLTWFVDEQVEEEASISCIVEKIKAADDDYSAILAIDHELKHEAQKSFKVNITC